MPDLLPWEQRGESLAARDAVCYSSLHSRSVVLGGGSSMTLTTPWHPKLTELHTASPHHSPGVVFFFWGPRALFLWLIHPLWSLQFHWHRCQMWFLLRSLFWSWGDIRSWWCGAHGSHFPQTPAGAALLWANITEKSIFISLKIKLCHYWYHYLNMDKIWIWTVD